LLPQINAIPEHVQALAFELDEILYPQREYDLQVYYLFASFLEFTEGQIKAADLVAFFKDTYDREGAAAIFKKAQACFPIPDKYLEHFERLHVNAVLPVRLELFPEALSLLKDAQQRGIQLLVLTAGTPLMQLNKIRFLNWQGFEKELKVYFLDELAFRGLAPITFIAEQIQLPEAAILRIPMG